MEIQVVAEDILKENRVCTLATVGTSGPWATTLFFVNDGLRLYVTIEKAEKTASNIKRDPRVGVAVDNRSPVSFIQMAGRATILSGAEADKAWSFILERLPEIQGLSTPESHYAVRIDPSKINVSDVPKGWFPAKVLEI